MALFRTRGGDAGDAGDGPGFAPTKANLYAAVKAIFHPSSNPGVTADDTNNELDVPAAPGGVDLSPYRIRVLSIFRAAVDSDFAALTAGTALKIGPAGGEEDITVAFAYHTGAANQVVHHLGFIGDVNLPVGSTLDLEESDGTLVHRFPHTSRQTSLSAVDSQGDWYLSAFKAAAGVGAFEEIARNSRSGGGEDNVQADWDETDSASDAFIANKPTIPAALSDLTGTVTDGQIPAGITRDSEISNVMRWRGQWATNVTYAVNDVVDGLDTPNSFFVCRSGHTSSASRGLPTADRNTYWYRIGVPSVDVPNVPDAPAGAAAATRYELNVAPDGTATWVAAEASDDSGTGNANRYVGWHDTAAGITATDVLAGASSMTNTLTIPGESTDGWLWFWVPDSLGTVQEVYFDGNNHDQLGAFSAAVVLAVGGVDGMLYVIANEQNPDILGTGTRTLRLVYGTL